MGDLSNIVPDMDRLKSNLAEINKGLSEVVLPDLKDINKVLDSKSILSIPKIDIPDIGNIVDKYKKYNISSSPKSLHTNLSIDGKYAKYFQPLNNDTAKEFKFLDQDKVVSSDVSFDLIAIIKFTLLDHLIELINYTSKRYITANYQEDSNYFFRNSIMLKDSQGKYYSLAVKSFFQAGYFIDERFFTLNPKEEFCDCTYDYELIGEVDGYKDKYIIEILKTRNGMVSKFLLQEKDIHWIESKPSFQVTGLSEQRLADNNANIGSLCNYSLTFNKIDQPIRINSLKVDDSIEITTSRKVLVNKDIEFDVTDDQAYFLDFFLRFYNRGDTVHVKDINSELANQSHDLAEKSTKAITALCSRLSKRFRDAGLKKLVVFEKNKFSVNKNSHK